MKVIERYILRRTLLLFAAALTWTLAIVWTTQVLTRIDLVTDNGQSALTFFEIATLILPSVIPLVLPFAIVIAVAQTLTVMNNDSELVVIGASGASRGVVIKPVLLLAIVTAVTSFAVDNGVDPYARQRGRELVAAARSDLLSIIIQEGTFRTIEDGLFIQIGERMGDGSLGGIFVADSRTEGVDLVYYAKTGAVVKQDGKDVLIMRDGTIHRKEPGGDVSVIRFDSYSFDLSVFAASAKEPTMYPKDRTLQYLFNPDANDHIWKNKPQLFRTEIHRRFTEWLYPIVFAMISLAVTGDARSHREARIHPLITAIVICLLVRWLGFFAANQSQSLPWIWPLIYVAPIGAIVISAWFIRANRTMELPVSMADRVGSAARAIAERLMFMRFWRGRGAASGETA